MAAANKISREAVVCDGIVTLTESNKNGTQGFFFVGNVFSLYSRLTVPRASLNILARCRSPRALACG